MKFDYWYEQGNPSDKWTDEDSISLSRRRKIIVRRQTDKERELQWRGVLDKSPEEDPYPNPDETSSAHEELELEWELREKIAELRNAQTQEWVNTQQRKHSYSDDRPRLRYVYEEVLDEIRRNQKRMVHMQRHPRRVRQSLVERVSGGIMSVGKEHTGEVEELDWVSLKDIREQPISETVFYDPVRREYYDRVEPKVEYAEPKASPVLNYVDGTNAYQTSSVSSGQSMRSSPTYQTVEASPSCSRGSHIGSTHPSSSARLRADSSSRASRTSTPHSALKPVANSECFSLPNEWATCMSVGMVSMRELPLPSFFDEGKFNLRPKF